MPSTSTEASLGSTTRWTRRTASVTGTTGELALAVTLGATVATAVGVDGGTSADETAVARGFGASKAPRTRAMPTATTIRAAAAATPRKSLIRVRVSVRPLWNTATPESAGRSVDGGVSRDRAARSRLDSMARRELDSSAASNQRCPGVRTSASASANSRAVWNRLSGSRCVARSNQASNPGGTSAIDDGWGMGSTQICSITRWNHLAVEGDLAREALERDHRKSPEIRSPVDRLLCARLLRAHVAGRPEAPCPSPSGGSPSRGYRRRRRPQASR